MQIGTTKRVQITIREANGTSRDIGLSLPWGKVSLDAVVPLLQLICDNILAIQLSKTPVSCAAGCAHCCYQLIPVSAAEAVFLNKLLRKLPRTRRRKIERGFQSIQDKSQSLMTTTNREAVGFDQSYFQMGVPCPFLEDKRCGIYQERPLACREYHVNSPSQYCINPYRTNPVRAAKGLNIAALLSAFCTHLLQLPEKVVPLYAIDKWGNDHPATRTTFDAEWVFTKLMNGIVKAGSACESISGIDWQFIEDDELNRPSPLSQLTAHDAFDNRHRIEQAPDQEAVLPPRDTNKLLVQHANAKNISKIVRQLLLSDARLKADHPFIEIGAGDGYLRYLGSLCIDMDMQRFCRNIIETESDATLVADNRERGKHTLSLHAQDLVSHFGEQFTPLVISFNVLDVFSQATLDEVLTVASNVLMQDGRVTHIMSSAIHTSIFRDIAVNNPGKTLLPFYGNGTIGVILVDKTLALPSHLSLFASRPNLLPALFKQSPEEYLSIASQVQSWIGQNDLAHECLLLHEYSMNKICAAMETIGLVIEHNGIVDSTVTVACSEMTKALGNANTFVSRLGILTMDRNENVPSGRVMESSSFGFIVGRKQ